MIIPRRCLKGDENAISNIFGMLLIVFISVILAGAILTGFQNSDTFQKATEETPMAMIGIESVNGGSSPGTAITLIHRIGDEIPLNSTLVIIRGKGAAFARTGENSIEGVEGDLLVKYTTMGPSGKAASYGSRNPMLDDHMWSSGEKLILGGRDGNNTDGGSSVLVSVNGMSDTLNDYSLKPGTSVTVMVVDTITQRMITEATLTVQPEN